MKTGYIELIECYGGSLDPGSKDEHGTLVLYSNIEEAREEVMDIVRTQCQEFLDGMREFEDIEHPDTFTMFPARQYTMYTLIYDEEDHDMENAPIYIHFHGDEDIQDISEFVIQAQ